MLKPYAVLIVALTTGIAACDSDDGRLIDRDFDGFYANDPDPARVDCDDNDPLVNPAAIEVCDGRDNNCNGLIDEEDPSLADAREFWPDLDGDGFGVRANEPRLSCTAPSGYAINRLDCDDSDPLVFPGAPERCNGKDDNCNGNIDEGFDLTARWYADLDRDGYGRDFVNTGCPSEPGLVRNDLDCSDISAAINPSAPEICDGIDNNCSGLIDDEDPEVVGTRTFYLDDDDDGYGDPLKPMQACSPPPGAVDNALDCNDNNRFINPETIWYRDADWDGHGDPNHPWPTPQCEQPFGYVLTPSDCDDTDPEQFDLKAWYVDADRDGYGFRTPVAIGCDPDPRWVGNGLDCDDRDPSINPDAQEICDGVDNNCNGLVDDADPSVIGQSLWYRDRDGDGYGVFFDTLWACFQPEGYADRDGDCDDTNPQLNVNPQWYRDADRDGFGDPDTPWAGPNTCEPVPGHVPNDEDCDDTDFFVSPRTPWFLDEDGDGVGQGHVPALRACINPDPSRYAPVGGDCDDNDPDDDEGGCFGVPTGLVGLEARTGADPITQRARLECAASGPVVILDITPADALTTLQGDAEVPESSLCLPSLNPEGGSTTLTLFDCGEALPPEAELLQASPCQGCTDPAAMNHDPRALVSQDVCYYY